MRRRVPFPRQRRKISSRSRRQTPLQSEYRRIWDQFSRRSFPPGGREAIHAFVHYAQVIEFPASEIAKLFTEQ